MNMLTKDDLQAIRGLIGDAVEQIRGDMNSRFNQVDTRFDGVDARFDGVDARLKQIDVRFDQVETRLDGVEKGLLSTKGDIRKIKKDIEIIINVFDKEDVRLQKRVKRIENRLGLPPME